ncbi:MAG: hypothetical protein JWO44_2222 [Bacteroidetes bacterium]|nr:hypothetical protein [Bacteroidota bacterium]
MMILFTFRGYTTTMKKNKTYLVILFCMLQMFCFAQTDTVINGRHYSTVIKYHNFDYKGKKESSFITAYGNMKDSVKEGKWMYVLPDGTVLATGRFHNGYKTGDWKYIDYDRHYFIVTWKRSRKVKDFVAFENNIHPQLVDYDTLNNTKVRINGHRVPTPTVFIL